MSERRTTDKDKLRAGFMWAWEAGWDAHEAFVQTCGGSLPPTVPSDGVCTCPAITNGDLVDRLCVRHGPGGVDDCFRPPLTTADDETLKAEALEILRARLVGDQCEAEWSPGGPGYRCGKQRGHDGPHDSEVSA